MVSKTDGYAKRIDAISDRTLHRFRVENQIVKKRRMKQQMSNIENYQRYYDDAPIPVGAEEAPKDAIGGYRQRVQIANILLDGRLSRFTQRDCCNQYCSEHQVSQRTVYSYAAKFRNRGPKALLFYKRSREKQPRIHDNHLAARVLEIARENPSFSIPGIRKAISKIGQYRESINKISSRMIYRFLNENGLSKMDRIKIYRPKNPELIKKGDYSYIKLRHVPFLSLFLHCKLSARCVSSASIR